MDRYLPLALIVALAVVGFFTLDGRASLRRVLFREIPLDWLTLNLLIITTAVLVIRLLHLDIDPFWVQIADRITENRMINLQNVTPNLETIRHVFRLDSDEDGIDEWLVLYRYDPPGGGGRDVLPGPYGAAVYDVDKCRPPALVSYELRPHDYDYVAENVSIWWSGAPYLDDINADGKQELIIHIGDTLSVFRWFDHTQDCMYPAPGNLGYQVLGTFRGSGGIRKAPGGRVVVMDRAFFERSQLAIKRVYSPNPDPAADGSYYCGNRLCSPVESIDFAVGQPITVTQAYYPEKAVLSFYLALGVDNTRAASYLSSEAAKRYDFAKESFGVQAAPGQFTEVRVKEVRYSPNVEGERLHQPQEVTVGVASVRANGQEDPVNFVTWRVIGVPRKGALPYNCEWRLDEMVR
ncbi:MAG: hypothetical protein ACUVXG_06915 [Anaerolineae bacterium]